ncbi:demethylmenaquinone methyltransferase [Agromyces protaetiae]|uniref:Demethylmenaquinone methyltransferase n=1 Tax=Agromyces protaetiae TaxID=2509455 RepID=A0A4P6F9M7_9MICO|nr:demethylmenaquinone methyltransferase [Agromyces protaetiae]QAY72266.1 demethylmenaquinone methyltransferase [Agromyces protaetiae]
MSRADLGKDPSQVSAMFDQVAARYDRTNNVLSVGNAPLWRAATTKAIHPVPGERILDVAAGTGTSSASLARSGASIVAADFSPGMIEVGRRRQAHVPNLVFVEADATKLPFDDESFDAVTISFGLRNVNDPKAALREFLRVAKPGGRLVVCEFSHPPRGLVRKGYGVYSKHVMPRLVKLSSSNDTAYDYLNESIEAWPDQRTLAAWIREAGWGEVEWRDLTLGVVALHRAVKPAPAVE